MFFNSIIGKQIREDSAAAVRDALIPRYGTNRVEKVADGVYRAHTSLFHHVTVCTEKQSSWFGGDKVIIKYIDE